MALGQPLKHNFKIVPITIAVGAATASSAADPDLVAPAFLVGLVPTGVATTTGFGLIDSVTLASDGSVTVTTRAVVATANLTVNVIVGKASNQ